MPNNVFWIYLTYLLPIFALIILFPLLRRLTALHYLLRWIRSRSIWLWPGLLTVGFFTRFFLQDFASLYVILSAPAIVLLLAFLPLFGLPMAAETRDDAIAASILNAAASVFVTVGFWFIAAPATKSAETLLICILLFPGLFGAVLLAVGFLVITSPKARDS